ncbi:5-oxoprolinase subunit PxpA [Sinomicrobium pectinilyticum]|uniref:5-oxoprolinase subunit PxpA n=1 Tax=Sinomicrobium pectinilyticum TaxID=1084421 RepID=A0A3N0EUL6_SINP1|nr:5-oxoprolinase subunit PxpA [Sinomicrobium pectinilyticum]RNL91429.1 5-oxoprolinase subunit PxpA [Sinomicrobium pectinilyticum]
MSIKLNCDVGEGLDNEHLLMPYISSCSIACGGHAGDRGSMQRVADLAVKYKVGAGAHPSYPDRENFGRESIKMEEGELMKCVQRQVVTLENVLREKRIPLHHIKAHGALYNDMARKTDIAEIFLSALISYRERVPLYVPYNSEIAKLAVARGFRIIYEAFADRNYNNDLSLLSRKEKKAVILDKEKVLRHVLFMAKEGKVRTSDGSEVKIRADTFCLHGDNAHAVEILKYLYNRLR